MRKCARSDIFKFTAGSPIKAARMEAGLSRAEMSRQFRIPIRTLENWEAGINKTPEWAEMLVLEKLERMVAKETSEL